MEQNALDKLKSIGVEKIKEATRLDIGKIEDILEKRFEKITPVRAKGFIQILEKEFSLDLSSWLKEYDDFHSQGEKKETNPQDTQGGGLFWVACMGLLLGGGGLLYWIYSQSTPSSQPIAQSTLQAPTSPTIQPTQEVQENEIEESVLQETPQENQTPPMPIKELSEYGESIFPNIAYDEENVFFITSQTPLWVGIVNLDTKKRVSKTKEEFDIPLDKQLLISIARGGFSASLDDEEKFFGGYKPVYLIYTKEGGMKQISKEEFIFLNGGVEW